MAIADVRLINKSVLNFTGGAMKSTKSGQKWAHVACALWIPEVSIGSVERMEPITKIPNIPVSVFVYVKLVQIFE